MWIFDGDLTMLLGDRLGIVSFTGDVKKIKGESGGLLTDGASMVLFVAEERPLDNAFSEERTTSVETK